MMVFLTVTLESWSVIMIRVVNSTNYYTVFYFIVLVLIGGFFIVNLMLAVITIHFIFQQKVTSKNFQQRIQKGIEERKKFWHVSTLKKLGFLRYYEPYDNKIKHKLKNYTGFQTQPEFKRK
jgi:hypothetical protein